MTTREDGLQEARDVVSVLRREYQAQFLRLEAYQTADPAEWALRTNKMLLLTQKLAVCDLLWSWLDHMANGGTIAGLPVLEELRNGRPGNCKLLP